MLIFILRTRKKTTVMIGEIGGYITHPVSHPTVAFPFLENEKKSKGNGWRLDMHKQN